MIGGIMMTTSEMTENLTDAGKNKNNGKKIKRKKGRITNDKKVNI
jgi:hypothetical protein